PELFPTHLRSTGISFCYNVGRFIAASGPALLGLLTSEVYNEQPEPMRYAGLTMCSVFLFGLLVLPFAPETRNQPLPEDQRGPAHGSPSRHERTWTRPWEIASAGGAWTPLRASMKVGM